MMEISLIYYCKCNIFTYETVSVDHRPGGWSIDETKNTLIINNTRQMMMLCVKYTIQVLFLPKKCKKNENKNINLLHLL